MTTTVHPPEINDGVVTTWLPLPTVWPSVSACSTRIYSQENLGPGALAIAFDPFFGQFINSDITCLPPFATSWWNQVTQNPPQSVTSLGPFACPGLYTTASTSVVKPGSTFVACCPTSYDFQPLVTRLGQCNSPLSVGQIFTFATSDADRQEFVSATTTISVSSSVLAVHVNGYVFAPSIRSTSKVAITTSASSTVTTLSTTATPSSTADLASQTGISSTDTSLLPTSDTAHGGFSTGAKAGIGVGVSLAIVGLASLIGAFFLFRRRQKRGIVLNGGSHEDAPPYSSRKPSSTFSWQDPLVGPKNNNVGLGFVHELSTTPRTGF